MLLKTLIEQVVKEQQSAIQQQKRVIPRTEVQGFLTPSSGHIEVITGIRRCGKSTALFQIWKDLSEGVYLNLEDSRLFGFELSDFSKFNELLPEQIQYCYFDEIQNVESWEIYIRQLHDRGIKVFITGSNASLLSKELGTRLTGRHLRHELFPFSFEQFCAWKELAQTQESFEVYLQLGGFPEFLVSERKEVLQTLFTDILLRDIVVRYQIRNSKSLVDIALHLISNIGKEVTYNKLKNAFQLGSANTVSDFLKWLEDAYMFFLLPKFSWSSKQSLVNARKVYAIDNGMINANSKSFSSDYGRMLENWVFIQLRRNSLYEIFYFKEKHECDFIVFKDRECKQIIQVCWEINPDNQEREVNGMMQALKFFDKSEGIIVTMNQKDRLVFQDKVIDLIPAIEFKG
jgi:predicted AAA+ superfamily ATPase